MVFPVSGFGGPRSLSFPLLLSDDSVIQGSSVFPAAHDFHDSESHPSNMLISAAIDGSLYDVQEALKAGADIQVRDEDGDSPLHLVVLFGDSLRVIDFLLSQGADPNALNTPLNIPRLFAKGFDHS